jgi:hypothetical protein
LLTLADRPEWIIVASEVGGEHVDVCVMTLPGKLSPASLLD